MIREIQISASDSNDGSYYEPPTKVLTVAVGDGEAFLALHPYDRTADRMNDEPVCKFQVKAGSLVRALQVAIEDEQLLGDDQG